MSVSFATAPPLHDLLDRRQVEASGEHGEAVEEALLAAVSSS